MNILGITAAAALALLAGAFVAAPRAELVTEIEIGATPDEVWSLLGDASSHKSWNPFLVKMEGEMREGARLTNTMRPAGGSEMTFRPVVLKAEPGRELRWLGRFLLPRIFDGEHYFLLQKTESGTRLIHGEKFRGIGLWFIDVEAFRSDFLAMNAALKKRVEQGA